MGGKYEFGPAWNMHECIKLKLTEVAVVYINIAIHFFQVNPKNIWIIIDQVHGKGRPVKSQVFDFEVFQIPVLKPLWFRTRGQYKDQRGEYKRFFQE